MIEKLHIRNYALIKELDIQFGNKLNIITGETGAGKSIILGALGLLLGNRADGKALEYIDEKCVIEAHFNVSELGLESLFSKNDLDFDTTAILRREINVAGKSRAFVNDSPVTLNVLKDIGEKLVDIHSQHSNLLLKDEGFRREFVDFIGANQAVLQTYRHVYKDWKHKSQLLEELKNKEADLRAKAEFNQFQFQEIAQLNLVAAEYEENERELDRLNNAERISETFLQVNHLLDEGENATLLQLSEMKNSLQKLLTIDPKIEEIYQRIESCLIELQDVSADLGNLIEEWTFDETRLNFLNERQDKIQRLMRKHLTNSVEDLLEKARVFKAEFDLAENFETDIKNLEKEVAQLHKKLLNEGEKLFEERKKAAKKITPVVVSLLRQLGIPDANFEVQVNYESEKHISKNGIDKTLFAFSANKGIGMQEVNKVASGGEISRIMLALKTLMSDSNRFPSLIFDEIDLGISGEVAIKMGALMRDISQKHQVICITHLPQIAAMGQKHFRVKKYENQNRSYSNIEPLNNEERIVEIGQMIGGLKASETAFNSAKELLQKFA